MKNKQIIIVLSFLLVASIGFIAWQNLSGTPGTTIASTEDEEKTLYTCGMHPEIISDEPGNCPICEMKLTPIKNEKKQNSGDRTVAYWVAPMDPNEIYNEPGKSKMGMDLVPVYEDELSGEGVVNIDPVTQQNMNIRTVKLEKRSLSPSITTNGIVQIDERNEYTINTKAGGWIEELYVNYTGQEVRKGERLLKIYSPELVSAQQEYISALKYQTTLSSLGNSGNSGSELLKNSYNKLKLLDVSESEINRLKEGGEPVTYMNINSPVSGTVIMKNVRDGEKISAGTDLLHIADLSDVWVSAELYEHELAYVEKGDKVNIYIDAYPGQVFEGKIDFVYPTVDPKTRTVKVRADVNNKNGLLKPSMLARVEIQGDETEEYPVIPEDAVIRSGKRNIAIAVLGEGKYKPVEVKLGKYANGYYQVLSGLHENNTIVTSAQFLIDSESNLKSAVKKFSSDTQANSGKDSADTTHMQHKKIDVAAADKNKDGKVWQCPMDWDVLADEAGRCPECEMKLKEFTVEQAEKNLKEHGYMVEDLAGHDHGQMTESEMKNMDHPQTDKNNVEHDGHGHQVQQQESIVREQPVNVAAVDKNGDGKVWQCPMDWNVISDEAGRCPLCEMKLKEYTIEEAVDNLKEHDYEVMSHEHAHKVENEYGVDSPLIRTGKIDVAALDKNKDGKLWQCPMDWNVIGDEYQRCPVCEMKMKEYTLEETKQNLIEHGYEVK